MEPWYQPPVGHLEMKIENWCLPAWSPNTRTKGRYEFIIIFPQIHSRIWDGDIRNEQRLRASALLISDQPTNKNVPINNCDISLLYYIIILTIVILYYELFVTLVVSMFLVPIIIIISIVICLKSKFQAYYCSPQFSLGLRPSEGPKENT